jgi:hypothetical protein
MNTNGRTMACIESKIESIIYNADKYLKLLSQSEPSSCSQISFSATRGPGHP